MPVRTFTDITKFNPNHGADGRFATANGASSSTTPSKGFKGTLYHGSPATDIEEFDMSRAGSNTQSGEKLLFFTDSKQMAEDFSYERIDTDSKFVQQRGKKGRVYEVDVEMKNPLDFRNLSDKDIDNIIQLDANGLLTKDIVQSMASNHQLLKASLNLTADNLKKLGYDGLIANTGSSGHGSLEYAVVDSSQAVIKKSVTATRKAGYAFVDNRSAHSKDAVFSIHKTDHDKRLVFGWASISITLDGEQLEDRQQDMIDPEDLEEAAYEYVLNFRDTGEEHISTMRKKGKLVESCVFTAEKQKAMGIPEGTLPIGWWIGFYIEDDDAWERVKNGTYKMFSIEGKANREPVEKTDKEGAKAMGQRTIGKSHPDRYDYIEEVPVAKTFDQIIEKFNPYHDSRGRFSSSSGATSFTYSPGKSKAHDMAIAREKERMAGAANRNYGQTDTRDALDEIKGGQKNSLSEYMDENGKLTPEREAVHRRIIDELLAGKTGVEGQATMTMLGGGPASGKSSVMNPDTSKDPHAVTVDPDAIKNMLPGFSEMAKQTPDAASFYHEESSALAKRFYETALSENMNVIYDGTGDGSTRSVQKKIDSAHDRGYRVAAKYVTIDTETAVARNEKRYQDAKAAGQNPRRVPPDYVRNCHAAVTDISVAMAPKFDSFEVWDNNGARGQQKLIATGGGGKSLSAVSGQTDAFAQYLNKGHGSFVTLPNGQVIPAE